MGENTFPKYERLSGERRISTLFDNGEKGFTFPFRYVFSIREADGADKSGISVLISVSKRYHKRANKRNLLKRLAREAFRTQKHELRDKAAASGMQIDVALIYSTKEIFTYQYIENAVGKILATINERF